MADIINITNLSSDPDVQIVLSNWGSLITILQAVGGLFILGAIVAIWNIIKSKKLQKKMDAIKEDLNKIKNKLKIK